MDKLIQLCRKKIEDKLRWGDSEQWTSQDFEVLSEKIFEHTQVRLSVTTLKRIWGKVRYESSPNMATLNALAKFMGYENWRNFRTRYAVIEGLDAQVTGPDRLIHAKPRRKRRSVVVLVPAFLVVLSLLSFFLIKHDETPAVVQEKPVAKAADTRKPVFKSSKTSDDLPNSVVFEYDASMYDSEQVYIQQNWDPERREKVNPKGNYHTSIYYYPGYFNSKLIVNGEAKAEDVVFINTNGWKGMVNLSPIPAYLPKDEFGRGGSMGITSALLAEKVGSKVFNNVWSSFHNVREFEGLTGEDFLLETSLRNTSSVEEAACRKVIVYVLGSVSAVIVPLSDKGCISELSVLTPDGWIDGRSEDLSAFGCDFSSWQQLSFGVSDQTLSISLNAREILRRKVAGSIGDIIGLRIMVEGAGEVDMVRLSGREGVVLEDNF